MIRTGALLLFAIATLAQPAKGQDAAALVQAADQAARASNHAVAIASYEAALRADPNLEPVVLGRLGRQYLWAGETARGVALLARALESAPNCELRLDYALGLSWLDRLGASLGVYREVAESCPALRMQARLGQARVLRWDNQPAAAERAYREVLTSGALEERQQAEVGMAFTALADSRPREARALLAHVDPTDGVAADVYEGRAMAAAGLGLRGEALRTIGEARTGGHATRSLESLAQRLTYATRPHVQVETGAFEDRDGTRYRSAGVSLSTLAPAVGQLQVLVRSNTLVGSGAEIDGQEVGVTWDRRFGPAWAATARLAQHAFGAIEFHPTTGEANLAWTPGDASRVDLSLARLFVPDNVAAMQAHLTGLFTSVGLDQRISAGTALSASADVTHWSEGNRRFRSRVSLRHRFPGTPAVGLEWPITYQVYDQPFEFVFFSPRSYIETGPALGLDARVGQAWYVGTSLRAGAQRESGMPWRPLTTARLTVSRAVLSRGDVVFDLGWSNSNLAGTTGFQRTSAALSWKARF